MSLLPRTGELPGVLEISDDVNLAIDLGTGFTGNSAQVIAMELFQDVSGSKGAPIGTWQRDQSLDSAQAARWP